MFNRIMALLLVLFLAGCTLAGCSTLESLVPRQYDNVEYKYSVDISVYATRAIHICSDPDKKALFVSYLQEANLDTMVLTEFATDKSDSAALKSMVEAIQLMVNDILIRGKFSQQYCVHKLSNIQASARIIARSLGQADQFNMCDGTIRERYDLFTKSFLAKEITPSEYKELVSDMIRLEKVDSTGCSFTVRQKHLQDLQLMETILPAIMSL